MLQKVDTCKGLFTPNESVTHSVTDTVTIDTMLNNNGINNGQEQKNVSCKQTLMRNAVVFFFFLFSRVYTWTLHYE